MRAPIVIESQRNRAFRQRIEVANVEALYSDAPAMLGGDGQDPDPHDLFDMALGSCKAITVQMYAKRKGWPLDGLRVIVARDDSRERDGVYRLDVQLEFEGALDDAMRQRLLEISERCPIQRLITQVDIIIETHLST
ncbi:OsmC family protein [Halomonas sp. 707D4]|nr:MULTISPECIES: OsmC family protein [unclassified Halomonas]MCP1313792.1 OsmC family protein [Halomonas sp. 707D7]MCP1326763.1 OsmC family protein [Halomonas sp. 707D4]